ncbi:MAG TPA: hypothetical protein VGJ18_19680 [Gemmatimonadaceae bacterium]
MSRTRPARRVLTCLIALAIGACHKSDLTAPSTPSDQIVFTPAQINSLDSTGHVLEQSNSSDPNVRAFVDSTLLVLTSGVVAKRLNVTTDLTSAPLYFVGVHRVFTGAASFSTWTVVGMDDPSHLASIVELGGYAPSNTDGVSGAVGGGVLDGLLLSVGTGGSVTEWFVSSGSGSIFSSAAGSACANFPPTPNVTCSLETMHVSFSIAGSTSSPTNGTRQAAVSAVDIPAMRLTYTVSVSG